MGNNQDRSHDSSEINSTYSSSRDDLTSDISYPESMTSHASDLSSIRSDEDHSRHNSVITGPMEFQDQSGSLLNFYGGLDADDFDLVNSFEQFMNRMNISNAQKSKMLVLPKEKKLAMMSMGQFKLANDPAMCLKQLDAIQLLEGKKIRKKANEPKFFKNLQSLEINLRTNDIDWVKDFIDEHKGLNRLIDYIKFRVDNELLILNTKSDSAHSRKQSLFTSQSITASYKHSNSNNSLTAITSPENVGDIQIAMLCLKAIMNNAYGLSAVLANSECLTHMARVMLVAQLRTITLVLDLLSAVCLFGDLNGHKKVMEAVQSFAFSRAEARRFQTLIYQFYDSRCTIEFKLSCLSFINIICNSAPDLNYRVRLYHEFSELGLDDFLDALEEECSSVKLIDLIRAYRDNQLDINELLHNYEVAEDLVKDIDDLKEKLESAEKWYTESEFLSIKKTASLEKQIINLEKQISSMETALIDKDRLLETQAASFEEILQKQASIITQKSEHAGNKSARIPDPPPYPPWGPVPPKIYIPDPPPNIGCTGPIIPDPPPNIPGVIGTRIASMANEMNRKCEQQQRTAKQGIYGKRCIVTHYRLPVFNWQSVNKEKLEGTVFSEIDDENILQALDFSDFEEAFKTRAQPKEPTTNNNTNTSSSGNSSGSSSSSSSSSNRVNVSTGGKRGVNKKVTVLPTITDQNRIRNIGIGMKKLGKDVKILRDAIVKVDVEALSSEDIEILSKLSPNESEIKAINKFTSAGKNKGLLLPEEKLLIELHSIERLQSKLDVLQFTTTCPMEIDRYQLELDSIVTASKAVISSENFKKILEIVLAFGNYMNSAKRGGVYGFKLESLDLLMQTWSTNKQQSLLHYIAKIVQERYPQYSVFVNELRHLQPASHVIFENLEISCSDLNKQCQKAIKELVNDKDNKNLKEFLLKYEPIISKIIEDIKLARTAYLKCAAYLGEDASSLKSNSMFSQLNRFRMHFSRAEKENEQKKLLLEQRMKDKLNEELKKDNQKAQMKLQNLNEKTNSLTNSEITHNKSYDGAVDNIISNLKDSPYRPVENLINRKRDSRKKRRTIRHKQLTSQGSFCEGELYRSESNSSHLCFLEPNMPTSPNKRIDVRSKSFDFHAKEPAGNYTHNNDNNNNNNTELMNKVTEEDETTNTPNKTTSTNNNNRITEQQSNSIRVDTKARVDSMGQLINTDTLQQNTNTTNTAQQDELRVNNSNNTPKTATSHGPTSEPRAQSPTHTPNSNLKNEGPHFVNDIARMFAKPPDKAADYSSNVKMQSEDPYLKSRSWLP